MGDFVSVIADGGRRAALEAIRDKLAVELAATEGFHAGPLARELRAVLAELDELPDGKRESTVDDLAARRAARIAQAARL